ncbi:MAG TPA: hypothetical protein VE912_11045, partial [Bacteroidales bacterium]|nr:hypothetical protein [Bacteroidales bacterium]
FFIIRREVLFQPDEKEKSIAILPFLDDSPEKGSTYIINGLCDEILDKLQKFEDFSVRSRTDMEKYRGSHKDIRQIGKELHVNYILEGSGQKINNAIKLRLQLIEAESGRHLWSQTYEEDTENIFALQENVAFSVAAELQTELSPEEKREVVKRSTENMAAYNLYLQGLEHFRLGDLATKTSDWSQSQMENKKGMKFFEEAVLYDSGFSDAYVQLSHYYIDKIFNNSYQIEYKKNCLDSGLYYAEKALQYDPEHEWALALKERYFCRTGRFEEAGKIRNKRNIHPVETYSHAEVLLSDYYEYLDFYNVLKYYFLYEQLKPDDVVTPLYMDSWVFNILSTSGHRKQAIRILDKILSQNSDTLGYILGMSNLEMTEGNFNISLEYCYKALDIDSTNLNALYNIMGNYLFLQQYAKSFEYLQKMVNYESGMTIPVYPGYVEGFAYLKNGQIVKAEALFRQNAKLMLGEIKANMPAAQRYVSHFYVFADLYALGEKEKAMEYLQRLKNMKNIPHLFIVDLDKWPGFFELHDDPVYIEVKKTVEARYQEEHDRIGQLLSEVGEIE